MVAQGVAVEMLADLIRDGADRARGGRHSLGVGIGYLTAIMQRLDSYVPHSSVHA